MIIGIDFDSIIRSSSSLDLEDTAINTVRPGVIEFIESLKLSYNIAICSCLVGTDQENKLGKYLVLNDIYFDKLLQSSKGTDIFISTKTLQFDGDFDNLTYSILRYRKNISPDYSYSPGDYGKLYYRLSLLPKGAVLELLKKYGYHPIIKNKLVLAEFALNVLPSEAWNSIFKKEFRATAKSNHAVFAEAWNFARRKEPSRRKNHE